jgi:hypothetical protein
MPYTIFFENKAAATAAAADVVIVDTLATEFDPASVVFGRTSHGNCTTSISGNVLKWVFTNIELPPNANPPEGEGWVMFTVTPKAGLASGTSIKNHATIVFDANPPIATPDFVNILDYTAPTSTIASLPANVTGDTVILGWTSADATPGSGVDAVTVFMQADSGSIAPVAVGGGTGPATVRIPRTGTYTFYTLARDAAGNVETTPRARMTAHITTSGVESAPITAPRLFTIDAYPNPTAFDMHLTLTVHEAVRAKVQVVNVMGKIVETLRDGMLYPGALECSWNAAAVPAGVYRIVVTGNGTMHAINAIVTH